MTDNLRFEGNTLPLEGIRVLELGSFIAAPFAARLFGDFGAEVIKIEHPKGDPVRYHGASKDGVGLWGKVVGRNKRGITINLKHLDGLALFKEKNPGLKATMGAVEEITGSEQTVLGGACSGGPSGSPPSSGPGRRPATNGTTPSSPGLWPSSAWPPSR